MRLEKIEIEIRSEIVKFSVKYDRLSIRKEVKFMVYATE